MSMSHQYATGDPGLNHPSNTVVPHALGLVTDDWHAADVWLRTIANKSATRTGSTVATYRQHLAKLRWYCESVAHVQPSNWSVQDALAFTDFLKSVPVNALCEVDGRRYVMRRAPGYSPFRRQPAPSSQSDILRFVRALFNAWHKAGYISRNPLMFDGAQARRRINVHLSLGTDLYSLIMRGLEDEVHATRSAYRTNLRDRFALVALRELGLRAGELVGANMGAFYLLPDPRSGQHYWICRVEATTSKGGKERHIPASRELMEMLARFRLAFGLDTAPRVNESTPLLLSARTIAARTGMGSAGSVFDRRYLSAWQAVRSRQGLYRIVKSAVSHAADGLELTGQQPLADSLRAASPRSIAVA